MVGRAGGPFKAAQEAYERGDYAAVMELIKEDGSRAVPYPMLVCKGLAAQQIGQYEVAEDVLKRAAELQPDLPKAWRALADVYQARGAWLKAMEPLQAMHRIAQSKGNEGRALTITLEIAECLDKAGKSADARDALRAIINSSAPPLPVGVRGRALSRLLPLEEKRLVVFPRDRPKELTALYEALLDDVEAAMARGGDDDGGGGGSGGGAEEGGSDSEEEWVSSALTLLPALPELIMATNDKLMDWPHAVSVAKRVTAACKDLSVADHPSASELRVLGWWYSEQPQDDEVELLRLSKSLVQAHPHRVVGLTMVAARLLKNGHVPQALDFLQRATDKRATPQWSLSWSLLCEMHALHTDFAHTDQATMAAALDKVDAMARAEASVWGKVTRRDLARVNARCRGRYLEWTGDTDGARSVWQGLGPSDPHACLGLARIALCCSNDEDEPDGVIIGERGAEAAVRLLEGVRGDERGAEASALLGWALHVRGCAEDATRARELLEKATEANPRHGYYLGRLYWDTGMRAESLAALLKSAQAAPTHGPTFTALGDYYRLHAGDRVRALRCYTRAVTLSPLDAHAGNALSRTALQPRDDGGGDEEEAVAVSAWEAATRAHAGARWAWRWLGVYHLRRCDLEQALMCAQYAIRAAPKDMQAWAVLGRAYRRSGKHAAALKALNRALELGADVLGEMGAAQAQAGLVDEAVASLAEAGRAGGADVLILKALAEAYMAQGYARLAEGFRGCAMESVTCGIDAANRVVACSSVQRDSFSTAYKLKGDLSCMLMMIPGAEHTSVWEEAPEAYAHVSKASGSTAQALVDEAMCWYVLGRAKALAAGLGSGVAGGSTTPTTTTTTTHIHNIHTDSNTVVDTSPGGDKTRNASPASSSMMDTYGPSHCDPACLGTAKHLLESAIRKEPTCASAWTGRALVEPWCTAQAGRGDARGALIRQHCLIRSLQLQGNPEAWANLGVLYASMGREDLAREAFRGLQLVQDHPMMWLGLALLAEENGDVKSAREAYKAALEVGAHPEAQVGLATVTHDKGEALAHALMFLDQRPTHAAGLNLAATLLLDHAKKPRAAMELLQRCKALLEAGQARGAKGDAARRVVEWNLARANAASGANEQGQVALLEARRLAARGEWGPLCDLTSSSVPSGTDASLAVVWGIGASLAAYKAGQGEEAQSRLSALAASRPALTPQSLTQVVAASALCGFAKSPPWPTIAPPARHAVLVGLQQGMAQPGQESVRHLRSLCKAVRLHPHDPQCWAALASRLVGDAVAVSGVSSTHSSYAECARVAWAAVEQWRHGAAIDDTRPGQQATDVEVRDDGALSQDHAGAAAVQWAAEATGQAPGPKLMGAINDDSNAADTPADTTPPTQRLASGLVSLLKSLHRHPHLPHIWLTLAHGVLGWGALGDPASSAASPEVYALAVDVLRVMDGHGKHRKLVAVLDGCFSSEESDLRARRLAALGQLEEATDAYRGALRADPRWVEGWRELAEIYFARRRSAAGRKCLETALSVLPSPSNQDSSDTLRAAICGRLAQAQYVTGRDKEAMDAVGEACRALKRPGAVPLLLRGLCWRLEGPSREKNAQVNFKKAVEASPHCPQIRQLAQ